MKSGQLCEEIASLSPGRACFLGFSRGKDSIAAWLQLRNYFERVIPFHVASVPHLSFVDESLAYYEEWFGVEIERFMDGESMGDLADLMWQPPGSEEEIDALELWQYSRHEIVDSLRQKHELPHAWCAWGINQSDSASRRVYVNKYQGRIDTKRSFYPTWDWDKEAILGAITEAGIKLPPDYLIACRSFSGQPNFRHLCRMEETFPEDYQRVLDMFPMIEAELARQHFRRQHFAETKE